MENSILGIRRFGRREVWTWLWQVLLLAAAYVLTGVLGMQLGHYREGVTLVWAPTGLSLAALILFGRRLWPGIYLGTLMVSLGAPDAKFLASMGIAIGNTLESVVAVTILVRVVDFRPTLDRMQDGVAFLLIGVLGCTTISATIGVACYFAAGLVGAGDLGSTWLIWWLGDVGGALIMTPLLLTLVHGTPSWRSLAGRFETWWALAFLFTTSLFAFFGPDLGLLGFPACVSPVPVLVWAGTRIGPRAATVASFLIILIAVLATAGGSGPFVMGTPTEAISLLWAYAMLIGVTSFTLSSIVEQRNRADSLYRAEEMERLRIEKQKLLLLERERLTREMHDGLGGQLVSVLAMVERGLAAPSEIAEALRRAIDDIRIVIDSLDPDTLDLPTALGKLRARLEPLLRRNGIALRWDVDDHLDPDRLAPEAVLHVLRIIQEAVTNTLRHANASHVEVEIISSGRDPRLLEVTIRDDGVEWSIGTMAAGRGIRNMKSRAEELGAAFSMDNDDAGTQIVLRIPPQP